MAFFRSELKISEAVIDLTSNVFGDSLSVNEKIKLLRLSVLAWNISLSEKEEADKDIDSVAYEMRNLFDSQFNIKEKLLTLVEKKKKLYPKINKSILSYKIKNDGHNVSIKVIPF
jgi:hypothetical protein